MSSSSPQSDRSRPAVPPSGAVNRILFVDDHDQLRRLYVVGLQLLGYTVVPAASPLELERRLAEPAPDLVVIDVQRPTVDGLDAVRRLRARPHLQHTPIVFLASVADDDFRSEALSEGVDRYVLRPLAAGKLSRDIDDLLRTGRPPATAERQQRRLAPIVSLRQTG